MRRRSTRIGWRKHAHSCVRVRLLGMAVKSSTSGTRPASSGVSAFPLNKFPSPEKRVVDSETKLSLPHKFSQGPDQRIRFVFGMLRRMGAQERATSSHRASHLKPFK
eukprot:42958-Rhodomonas_salina.1